jgi:anti-anti-sigma factor
MSPSSPPKGLHVDTIGDVTVVRFTQRSLLSPDLVENLSAEIFRAVEERGCRKLVLNLAQVESMTTVMVGKVVLLKRKVEEAGGRMALCQLDPFLLQILRILNLSNEFTICADEPAALASF